MMKGNVILTTAALALIPTGFPECHRRKATRSAQRERPFPVLTNRCEAV